MLRKFRIGTRLSLAFAALLLVSAVQGVAALTASLEVNRLVAQLTDQIAEKMRLVVEAHDASGAAGSATGQCLLLMDFPNGAEYLKQQQDALGRAAEATAALLEMGAKGEHAELFDGGPRLARVTRAFDEVYGAISADYDMALARIKSSKTQATATIATAFALAVVLTIMLAWVITRSIAAPLREAMQATDALARGDLDSAARPVSGADELSRLQHSLIAAGAQLRDMVGRIRHSSDAIRASSHEIASGSQHLSSRTEQQAASLQQTAASMHELTSTVQSSAQAARTARQLALDAREVAQRSGTVVGEVVQTMSGIQASSRRIAEIIGVIDGIAFQTNILALNAAVEAARAGDQGRGFAVVAGEVRQLAQRSAQAAREIKGLIADSVEKVDSGHRLVASAGATMGELVDQVRRVTALIGEISTATGEQESGITQVNEAVAALDRMTQDNSALVVRSQGASESLRQQAEALDVAVRSFRIKADAARLQASMSDQIVSAQPQA